LKLLSLTSNNVLVKKIEKLASQKRQV